MRSHEKMTSHKEPQHDEGYPIRVYGQLFRPMELQVQRPWGREVPTTQGTSKEARGWTLKVRKGLVWKMIMCSLESLLGIGFLSERDRRLCDFMHHENHCAGGLKTECRGRGQEQGNQ